MRGVYCRAAGEVIVLGLILGGLLRVVLSLPV